MLVKNLMLFKNLLLLEISFCLVSVYRTVFTLFPQKKYDFTPSDLWEKRWRCWFEIQYDYSINCFYCQVNNDNVQVTRVFQLVLLFY